MNNFAITPNIPNANLSSANKSAQKVDSQNATNFLQAASESFMKLASSQTFMVPGSHNEESVNLWKNKVEIEKGLPDLEECLDEKMEDLIMRIGSLFNDSEEK